MLGIGVEEDRAALAGDEPAAFAQSAGGVAHDEGDGLFEGHLLLKGQLHLRAGTEELGGEPKLSARPDKGAFEVVKAGFGGKLDPIEGEGNGLAIDDEGDGGGELRDEVCVVCAEFRPRSLGKGVVGVVGAELSSEIEA